MTKHVSLLIFLLISTGLLAQTPCQFSWKAVRLPGGGIADYTSPQLEQQPYQGPCMAFAVVATLESQYEVDHNRPNRNLDLSEAYLDYRVWNWNNANVLGVFSNNAAVPAEAAGNFSTRCTSEVDCPLSGDVQDCINNGQCFEIQDVYNESLQEWEQQVVCTPCSSNMLWVRGTQVTKVNGQVKSVNDLKMKLINQGPLVLRLNGTGMANALSNYGSTGYSFHAVSLIGWKEVYGGIRLHFKDSWNNSAGFKYSNVISHTNLQAFISQGETEGNGFELFQIHNANVVRERIPYVNYSYFVPQDQCVPTPTSAPSISLVNEPVIKTGQINTLHSAIVCGDQWAVDWQWSIPNSSVFSPNKNDCSSTVSFITSQNSGYMQIKVRTKSSSGAWSAWSTRNFLIDNNLN